MGFSATWNANDLVQDLNSGGRIHLPKNHYNTNASKNISIILLFAKSCIIEEIFDSIVHHELVTSCVNDLSRGVELNVLKPGILVTVTVTLLRFLSIALVLDEL